VTASAVSADVIVRQNRFGQGLYSSLPVKRGSTLAVVAGRPVSQRTRMSIQVGWTTHVEIGPPWELINHSCDPNCHLAIRCGSDTVRVVAIRDIEPGEELSVDYDLFEYEVQYFPADCLCGSPNCRRSVRGYRFLSLDVREARAALVADYLKTRPQ